jgi:hypothetical protein
MSGNAPRETQDEWVSEQERRTGRKVLTPLVVVTLAASVLLAVLGTLDAARDPQGDRLWGALSVGAPVLATVVGVLSATFSRNGGPMPALRNVLLVPLVAGPLCALAVTVTVHLPPVHRELVAAWTSGKGFHYWFPSDTPLLGQSLGLTLLAGAFLGMLAGLAVFVVVTLPVLALWRPVVVVEQNLMDTSPGAAATNRRAVRTLALLLFLVFAVPTCFVVGSGAARADGLLEAFANLDDFLAEPGRYWADLVWVVGLLLVPVGLLAVVLTMLWQRPDLERRAAAGVPVGLDLTPWLQEQAPDQPEAAPDEEPEEPLGQRQGGLR